MIVIHDQDPMHPSKLLVIGLWCRVDARAWFNDRPFPANKRFAISYVGTSQHAAQVPYSLRHPLRTEEAAERLVVEKVPKRLHIRGLTSYRKAKYQVILSGFESEPGWMLCWRARRIVSQHGVRGEYNAFAGVLAYEYFRCSIDAGLAR